MFAFLDVPVVAAYTLVTWLADLTHPLLGSLSTVSAIVLFTACVRLLLHPLARAAVRGEQARAALAPQVRTLRKQHRNDPERLHREFTALYRKAGTSMFAGCLPVLLQLPFFTVLYQLFASGSVGGARNSMLDDTLLGAPLGGHFLDAFSSGSFSPSGFVFLGLLAALAAVAWCTVRFHTRLAERAGGPEVPGARFARLLPYGTMIAAAVLSLAVGVYLLTSTTWTLVERAALHRDRSSTGSR